jgi:hypothetical protein
MNVFDQQVQFPGFDAIDSVTVMLHSKEAELYSGVGSSLGTIFAMDVAGRRSLGPFRKSHTERI